MIRAIRCNRPSFKNLEFRPGFNVILAERTKEATRKDSRNGLGKSTLIEIMHFCLGGNKGETLKKSELDDWTFSLVVDLEREPYYVTRNTVKSGSISVRKARNAFEEEYRTKEWNRRLGEMMFGLKFSYDDLKYIPSFRSLISYFIRRNGRRGAFLNPFQHYKNQLEWDKQLHNAFLLGLGWEYASRWQVLKDRARVIDQIRQEAQVGVIADMMGTVGELEASIIRLESQIDEEEGQLRNFQVHPQYTEIEKQANDLTDRIHNLANQNVTDRRLLERYEESLEQEVDAKPDEVARMYKEAGVVFPNVLKRRLDQVLGFHKQVVVNRRSFLASEIERLRDNIGRREHEKQELSQDRAELMQILQTHGALEEYTQLQNNHQKTVADLEDFKRRSASLRQFEEGRSALVVEQALLQRQANTDLSERKTAREKAILLFNANSEALYEAPGTLSLDITKTGFKFNVSIERSGSQGIGNMEIFCYDLMLAQLWSDKENSPRFLVHDSNIFDGVDERQRALALQLAARECQKYGFQYICTMNSDMIPWEDFDTDFDFNSYVVETFTDATEDGGLLGIRF